jgi:tRNA (cmo5U34)-methyltransferase
MTTPDRNLWNTAAHAQEYLGRANLIPHRTEGEAVLLDCLPSPLGRVLDLGSGAGRLLGLVKAVRPEAHCVAADFSPVMLDELRLRFAADPSVEVWEHDMDAPLPAMGKFNAVVSSFAIHHLAHARKRALYEEIYALLEPRGIFLNLEHVSSPTLSLHLQFLDAIATPVEKEDPSNKLLDLETQLKWLREIGFADVDCLWKWRELCVMAGAKIPSPAGSTGRSDPE